MHTKKGSVSHKSAFFRMGEHFSLPREINVYLFSQLLMQDHYKEYVQIVKAMLNMDWLRLCQSHGIFFTISALIIDFIS